jgi:hypothetical protein
LLFLLCPFFLLFVFQFSSNNALVLALRENTLDIW